MDKQKRIAPLQVVFFDVEKYSRRRTASQIDVVDAMTEGLNSALTAISKKYIRYAQDNALNFNTDIIKLPTGDGAAVVFSFDGLHDIHLEFAKSLLDAAHQVNSDNPCEKFVNEGWCNCHPNFNLTVGISEGKGIIYKDVNGGFNVAGGVINMAARAMAVADRNQVFFTEDARRAIIELDQDPHLVEKFVEFEVPTKHGETITVYQYTDPGLPYLNSEPPTALVAWESAMKAMAKLTAVGLGPPPGMQGLDSIDPTEMLRLVDQLSDIVGGIEGGGGKKQKGADKQGGGGKRKVGDIHGNRG
jgi:class 3 adenylate cyclase